MQRGSVKVQLISKCLFVSSILPKPKEKLEPDETDSGIDSSLKDEVMRISQLLETSKSENNALKEEKFRLKQSFESFSKIVSLGEIENQLAGTDILDEVAKKFEVLLPKFTKSYLYKVHISNVPKFTANPYCICLSITQIYT